MTTFSRRPDRELEQAVADYLQTHPDFFDRHLELLELLRVPHPCAGAVSLIERQLVHLRERNHALRDQLRDLVRTAQANDCLSERMQRLNLVLIEAHSLDDMLHHVQSVLREDFNADFVTLSLSTAASLQLPPAMYHLTSQQWFSLFCESSRNAQPRCGPLDEGAALLFGEVAGQVVSAALVPLSGTDWQGVLAIGSRDPERFQAGIGTLFLSRIGQLLSHAVQAHLYPPACSAV